MSDFGTTFVFSPPPICERCLEVEIGAVALGNSKALPLVLTFGPSTHTDLSLFWNAIEDRGGSHRTGNRLDFVLRRQLVERGGFVLTVAPRGAVFLRDISGGRAGGSLAGQYGAGSNTEVVNLNWTRAVRSSAGNPRDDSQIDFDLFHLLSPRGLAFFGGGSWEWLTSSPGTAGLEQGIVFPFRNGQIEGAVEELRSAGKTNFQIQLRVIVNTGRR